MNCKSGYHLIFPTADQQQNEIYHQLITKVRKTLHKKVVSPKKAQKHQTMKGKESERQKCKDHRQIRVKQYENVAPSRQKKAETDKIKSHSIYT